MAEGIEQPDWIAVDWGTTHLRAWAMTQDGTVLAEAQSDNGMGALSRDEFEPSLLDLVAPWLSPTPMTVVACGMVGSRQGWVEAPYAATPCPPIAARMVSPATTDPRLKVHVIPGVKQTEPPDVMRGEETQIAGYLRLNPGFDGILCLPGTHTKWVRISEGQISAFRTSMTGEIFACLTQHSVLRHAVDTQGWNDAAFAEALGDAISRPEQMATRLFSLRADSLLNAMPPDIGTARLSGILIGMELASVRGYWLGQEVTLIGASALAKVYDQALAAQGVQTRLTDAGTVTRAGLFAAYETMKETAT
ncbi:MAG: 2-dehydro-3-deoxygalactonokinase [Paracoccaceae bacterium]